MEYVEERELCQSEQWYNRQTEGGKQGEKRMSGRSLAHEGNEAMAGCNGNPIKQWLGIGIANR